MIRVPSYAFIPGETARHKDGAFDDIRDTAKAGMNASVLATSDAFRHGLAYLDSGYFWEAHEVLEPVWMALPDGEEKRFVQGLIQLANGLLKERMNRNNAAARLAGMARDLIGKGGCVMGVARADVLAKIEALERRLQS